MLRWSLKGMISYGMPRQSCPVQWRQPKTNMTPNPNHLNAAQCVIDTILRLSQILIPFPVLGDNFRSQRYVNL